MAVGTSTARLLAAVGLRLTRCTATDRDLGRPTDAGRDATWSEELLASGKGTNVDVVKLFMKICVKHVMLFDWNPTSPPQLLCWRQTKDA
jgi:hypothetical protein